MRFMVMVKATADSEAGVMPTEAEFAAMGAFNEELVKAGVMETGEGLHPSSRGARVVFSGKDRRVIDGPFTETKEIIAGYTLIEVKSREEAIAWAMRMPDPDGSGEGQIELRQVFEAPELTDDAELLADHAALTQEMERRRQS